MPKLGIILFPLGKITVKRDDVAKISIGDINGDGKKEIVFGGGDSQAEEKTVLRYLTYIDSQTQNYLHEITKGFLKIVYCFDINNDGKDEVICGNNHGKVFLIKEDGILEEIFSFSKRVEDIKGIKSGIFNYIFSCSSDGDIGVIKFGDNQSLKKIFSLQYPVWSILPFSLSGRIFLVVGGEGFLSIYQLNEIDDLFLIDTVEIPNISDEKKDRIYCICGNEKDAENLIFFCGFRSGKIVSFQFSEEISFLSEYLSNDYEKYGESGSIYDIISCDIDDCGSDEIITVGKIRNKNKTEALGFIEITKFRSYGASPVYFKKCEKRLFSAQFAYDKQKNKKLLFASGPKIPLINFEIQKYQYEDIISHLAKQILKNPGQYCFFVGAGFSADVFPLADDLSDNIILQECLSQEKIIEGLFKIEKVKQFLLAAGTSKKIPLEAILYWYKHTFDRKKMITLLDNVFNKDNLEIPDHINILGNLMDKNHVNYVFSVNYDLLLEKSIKNSLVENISHNDDFISTKICHTKSVLHLHGVISDPDSIVASLDEVGELARNKKQVLEFLFNGHTIIFVGYSCKDPDLFPVLCEIIMSNQTSCYFVDPADPNENVIKILHLSSNGEVGSRYFQLTANDFFELLNRYLNIEITKGVTKNDNGVI